MTYCSHRILFLLTGHIHITLDGNSDHSLSDNQCLFISKDRTATVMAQTESELIMLDFNNRMVFCHNDILVNVAVRNGGMERSSPVLEIAPELISFFDYTAPLLFHLHIPCYHIVKEHELCLLMLSLYDNIRLGRFFRDILRPKDDFTLFVLSAYRRAKSAGELAAMAHMSEKTFTRKFQEQFHEPYHKWQVKQKAADIEQAVRDGIVNNDDLVRMFDFKSSLAFYRFCQRHLHCTPSVLKERHYSKQ